MPAHLKFPNAHAGTATGRVTVSVAEDAFPRRCQRQLIRQVFWLSDQSGHCTFPQFFAHRRSLGQVRKTNRSGNCRPVPDYSGGTATDFHRLPFSLVPTCRSRSTRSESLEQHQQVHEHLNNGIRDPAGDFRPRRILKSCSSL